MHLATREDVDKSQNSKDIREMGYQGTTDSTGSASCFVVVIRISGVIASVSLAAVLFVYKYICI